MSQPTTDHREFTARLSDVQEGRVKPRDDDERGVLRRQIRQSYYLVRADGSLRRQIGTLREQYATIAEGLITEGRSETVFTNLYPLAAYHHARPDNVETRSVNDVANWMLRALTGPEVAMTLGSVDPMAVWPVHQAPVRARMRGLVVFRAPALNISEAQEQQIRRAHVWAVQKCRARGAY